MKRPLTLELSMRVHRLLKRIRDNRKTPYGSRLRQLRCIELLEHTAHPDAQRLLRIMSEGVTTDRLTREAHKALRRLRQRKS